VDTTEPALGRTTVVFVTIVLGRQHGHADRGAGRAGPRRWRADGHRDGADRRRHPAARPRPVPGRDGRGVRRDHGVRADARRAVHRPPELAVVLLRQRAGGGGDAGDGRADPTGGARRGPAADRLRRHRAGRGRLLRAGAGPGASPPACSTRNSNSPGANRPPPDRGYPRVASTAAATASSRPSTPRSTPQRTSRYLRRTRRDWPTSDTAHSSARSRRSPACAR
jgi:hypothetical protein